MSDVKRIICLANSRKLSGRSIAGRDCQTENWLLDSEHYWKKMGTETHGSSW